MKTYYLLIIFSLLFFLSSCSYHFGNSWQIKRDKHKIISTEKIISPFQHPDSNNVIVKKWAAKDFPDWKTHGKIEVPRIMLAKLLTNTDVEAANKFMVDKKPWGKSGTSWALNPHGDYDFSEVPLVTILYLFGEKPELLYPATRENLLNNLLTHCGNKTHERTPGMMGMMRETENHVLMGETSRYLKNQWLHEHGDTSWMNDNARNGINAWWMACLNQKLERGFFEFNSNPYAGFSLTALLTFHNFCHNKELKEKCGEVLNDVFTLYAYGSLNLRRHPPIRRQRRHAADEKFTGDPVTSIVKTLLLKDKEYASFPRDIEHYGHTLLTLLSDYKLPASTMDLLVGKKTDYFLKKGHGYHSCPDIYSGNDDYLLSAGGAQRGAASLIAARPTMLFLNDSAAELNQCFHLLGKGKRSHWNLTGVYKQFACANQAVVIPAQYKPMFEQNGWMIFKPYTDKNFYVLVYNAENFGLLAVIPRSDLSPQEIIAKTIRLNASGNLNQEAILPFAEPLKIRYNVNAPKSKWVIESVNDEKQKRKLDKWKY